MNLTAPKAPASVTRTELFLVLGGLVLALCATPVLLLLSARASAIGFVWMLAILWTVLWSTRTGRYAYRRIGERNEALARDHPPFDG